MIDLTRQEELIVRQQVEGLEAVTGFETRNRYEVFTPDGESALYAWEESGGVARFFLKSHRGLDIHVTDRSRETLLTATRGAYWFTSHLYVNDGDGRRVGSLDRRWGMFKRRFVINDHNDHAIGLIVGNMFRPYTFFVQDMNEREVGRVTKQWSGLLREGFTDADTFQILFSGESLTAEFRLLLLASAFAIDLDFFES